MQHSMHRGMHRVWEDMPPNGISDAETPRKNPNSKRGRMGKHITGGHLLVRRHWDGCLMGL